MISRKGSNTVQAGISGGGKMSKCRTNSAVLLEIVAEARKSNG
jgi:hypothetical protein